MRALDVGCGPGALTAALAARLGPAAVHAAEPSEPFARACRARVPGAEVVVAPAERLPFAAATFDVTLAQLVVNFLADPPAGVREMARVTRPGGVVAGCVWDYAGEHDAPAGVLGRRRRRRAGGGRDGGRGRRHAVVRPRRARAALARVRGRGRALGRARSPARRTPASTTCGRRSRRASRRPGRSAPRSTRTGAPRCARPFGAAWASVRAPSSSPRGPGSWPGSSRRRHAPPPARGPRTNDHWHPGPGPPQTGQDAGTTRGGTDDAGSDRRPADHRGGHVVAGRGGRAGPARRVRVPAGRRELGHLHGDHAAHFSFPEPCGGASPRRDGSSTTRSSRAASGRRRAGSGRRRRPRCHRPAAAELRADAPRSAPPAASRRDRAPGARPAPAPGPAPPPPPGGSSAARADRRASSRRSRSGPSAVPGRAACARGHERLQHVDRQREDDRRALVPLTSVERLEVAQLDRDRVAADHVGGVGQACGGLELALGVDDLGAPFALGLGLARHRVLHALAGSRRP